MPTNTAPYSYIVGNDIAELQKVSTKLRKHVINMLVEAGSGHSAGALGLADILACLYFKILQVEPKNPNWAQRDRLVLSNGHTCPILYAALAEKGFFPVSQLKRLRKIDAMLQGHPHNKTIPGVDASSGPLGQGLSQAIGIALAAKLSEQKYETFCILSEGDLNEGNTWEAFMFAAKMRLNNLTVIIDRNNIQIDGYTEDVMPLEPLDDKLEAFGWHVIQIDGHNIEEIVNSINMSKSIFERPVVIIAHTIPGYGVDFVEYKFEWHGKPPNKKQAQSALKQLRTLEGKINCYDTE